MLSGCALTTASNSKRSLRRNMQNKPKLVLELFGEPTGHKPVENRAHDTRALWLRQPAMFETSCHHRARSAMPDTHRLRLDERDALRYRVGVVREQTITQSNQVCLIE